MSRDEWAEQTPDDPNRFEEGDEPFGVEDERFGEPTGQPPAKQGMSTALKVILILAALFGGLMLLCCGFFLYVGQQAEMIEAPEDVRRITSEIVDIEVPDSFEPVGAMTFWLFIDLKMAIYETESGLGTLMLGYISVPADEASRETFFSRMQQGPAKTEELNITERETREIEIGGETHEFQFARGTNQQGQEFRQIFGIFPSKEGSVLLLFQVPEDEYDEETTMNMLRSIE